jgi:hypothetical protein
MFMEPVVVQDAVRVPELEAICDSNEARTYQLPSGRTVLVSPLDGFGVLAAALGDSRFRARLKKSAKEFSEGKLKPFEP